jgi:hypothetical protein
MKRIVAGETTVWKIFRDSATRIVSDQ